MSRIPRLLLLLPAFLLLFSPCVVQGKTDSKTDPEKASPLDPHRLEWGAIGGPAFNVDTGLELAFLTHIARFRPGYTPYLWRLRITLKTAFRPVPDGLELPIHDYKLGLDLPGFFGGKLRLNGSLGFRRLILQYYGLGNASDGTRVWKQYHPDLQRDDYIRALRRYQYTQTAPVFHLNSRWQWTPSWFWFASLDFRYVINEPRAGSKLEEDFLQSKQPLTTTPTAVQALLSGIDSHMLILLQTGILWDTRNNEFNPSKGGYHELSFRISPGRGLGLRHFFFGANFTTRWFVSLYKENLIFAFRGIVDVLEGNTPFYLLTGMGGLFALDSFGGGNTLRGVRAQRYHGKIKALANFELRARFFSLIINRTWLALGIAVFFDVGRVWLDWNRFQTLDGEGPGLHFGTGAGIRAQWGKSLMIRIDFAWSTDASPIGVYFNLGHVF